MSKEVMVVVAYRGIVVPVRVLGDGNGIVAHPDVNRILRNLLGRGYNGFVTSTSPGWLRVSTQVGMFSQILNDIKKEKDHAE